MTSSTDDRRAERSGPRGTSNGMCFFGKRAFGAYDALSDGRFRGEERARDLGGGQTSEQTKRECKSRLGREHRMAGNEYQAQQIVTNIVIEGCIEIRHDHLSRRELATEFLVLAREQRVSAEVINRTMLGCGHKPGSRVVPDTRLWPLLERSDESILRKVLSDAHIAHHPCETGDQPR